jgi:hypothetical protein
MHTAMDVPFRRYALYLVRWQLSTPLLAVVLVWLASLGPLAATIVANLIGGLIFFWVDRFIFTSDAIAPQWEIREQVRCADCGAVCRGYRLVRAGRYDRTGDRAPEFRCEACSTRKAEELRHRGVSC